MDNSNEMWLNAFLNTKFGKQIDIFTEEEKEKYNELIENEID